MGVFPSESNIAIALIVSLLGAIPEEPFPTPFWGDYDGDGRVDFVFDANVDGRIDEAVDEVELKAILDNM